MDVTFASVVGVASLAGLLHFKGVASQQYNEIKDLETAKLFSPNRLLQSFESLDFLSKAKKNPVNPDEYRIKAYLEGTVDSDKPIISTIDNSTRLVHRIYHKETLYSNDVLYTSYFRDRVPTQNLVLRAPIFFTLKDIKTNDSCLIHRSLDVDASDAIQKIAEEEQKKDLSLFEKFLVFLGYIAEVLRSNSSKPVVRGILIGFTEREFGIRVGTALTVFGDIVYNSKDKTLRLDSPLYFLKDKANALGVAKQKFYATLLKIGLIALPFLFSCFFLYKQAVKYQDKLNAKRMDEAKDKLKKIKSLNLKGGYKCMSCLEKPRTVILKPCLHFSLCKSCHDKLKDHNCPVCSVVVNDAVEVFFS